MVEPQPATMSIYRVTNRATGVVKLVPDESAAAACDRVGWLIVDCHVIRVQPSFERPFHRSHGFMVAVPCRVCPFQYAVCRLPDQRDCELMGDVPSLETWISRVLKAHLCNLTGEPLAKKDYIIHQVFLPTSEAIAHLLAKL